MAAGAAIYFIGASLPVPDEWAMQCLHTTEWIQPVLLFCMLYISFCKVDPKSMRPRIWHLWLILIQTSLFALITLLLHLFPDTSWRLTLEGTMLVLLCPTATACAVVTQKLGGDASTTTTYTIIINLVISVLVPLLLPIAHPNEGITFLPAFITIINKVFPLLMLPLILAWITRYFLPRIHKAVIATRDLAFYMWAVALAIAISVTCRALVNTSFNITDVLGMAIGTLLACVFQFYIGKKIGTKYGMRIEGGQALGQKNTVFIIWLGYTFMTPITAVAGGFYSIWHNVINSYQLYRKSLSA